MESRTVALKMKEGTKLKVPPTRLYVYFPQAGGRKAAQVGVQGRLLSLPKTLT